jgi:hypothetical protein
MLTKLFNSNSIASLAILIMLAIALWAKAFVNIVPMAGPFFASPLYNFVFRYIGDLKIICAFITITLLIFEALLINYILAENDLIPRNSYIAAFIFIIVTGLFKDLIVLNPVLFSNLFIIAALWLLLRLYEETEAYAIVFNIGTLVSVASMFYFPSVIFILLIWAGFIIYRIFSWREWLISIIGLTLPYLFLGTYYFWNDCLTTKILSYKEVLKFVNFYDYSPTIYVYIVIALLGLLLLLSVARLLSIINEKPIRIRKSISFMIWFFIISFISLNLSSNFSVLGFVMMFASLTVLLTLYISYSKKPLWVEGILMLLSFLLISGRLGLWNF